MKISRYLACTAAALLFGALIACGGGGGGGGAGGGGSPGDTSPLTYQGNSSAAVITTANASSIAAVAIGGGDLSGSTSSLSGISQAQGGQGQLDIGRRMVRIMRATVKRPDGSSRLSSVPVDQTDPCANGGSVRIFGDVNANGTGTVTIVYTNCNEGGDTTSGQATMRVDAYDLFNDIPTDYTLSFARLVLRGTVNADISGSMRIVTNLFANSETVTENVVARYSGAGTMTKSENLVFIDLYNNVLNPSSFSEGISGRLYHSVHGYVDISTVTAFLYSTLAAPFPSSGEILIAGAANARIRATSASDTVVELALDLDNNGGFETQARMNWIDLDGPAGADLRDSDGDGMHNSWESAFGLNPSVNDAAGDPDNDGVTNIAEYQAGTRPNVANTFVPPTPANARIVTLANNSDIVYDPVTQRIYAAVRTDPGSVVPINPATGALGNPITVGANPAKLALSDNGQFLYVGLHGETAVHRINMATQAVDLIISLGTHALFGPHFVEDMQVLPGAPESIAVSRMYNGAGHAGVVIFDGATQRPGTTPAHTGSNVIEFSASADTLYGYNNETSGFGFYRMAVTAGGVSVTDVYDAFAPGGALITGGYGTDIRFGGGFLFTTNGQMIDPVARVQIPHPNPGNPGPTFTVPNQWSKVVPDPALSRVFYLVNDGGSVWSVRGYDTNTLQQTGSATITPFDGTPGSLIRWGARGLAFRTNNNQIFLLESPVLIP